jgi:hypothetical protein
MGERLLLLDGFELCCDGRPVALPMTAQRLLAFLALRDRPGAPVPGGRVLVGRHHRRAAHGQSAFGPVAAAATRPGAGRGQPDPPAAGWGVSVDYREAAHWAQALLDQPEGPRVRAWGRGSWARGA